MRGQPRKPLESRASHPINDFGKKKFGEEIREAIMVRKLKSGEYRLYSRKKNAKTGKRRNLGTFRTRKAAENHERAVQYFKHH